MHKQAIVVHSGGFDSSFCLYLAKQEFGAEAVLSLSFSYQQRHSNELTSAARICHDWGVDHTVVDLGCLTAVTRDALTGSSEPIRWQPGSAPSTLVVGRNGLMARLGAIHAHHLGAHCIYMGIMEEEARLVGYRDCSRSYMDLVEQILRLDLDDPSFAIRTPLVDHTKASAMHLADRHGILPYLLDHTISCYEGLPHLGCQKCPACFLKKQALDTWKETAL